MLSRGKGKINYTVSTLWNTPATKKNEADLEVLAWKEHLDRT